MTMSAVLAVLACASFCCQAVKVERYGTASIKTDVWQHVGKLFRYPGEGASSARQDGQQSSIAESRFSSDEDHDRGLSNRQGGRSQLMVIATALSACSPLAGFCSVGTRCGSHSTLCAKSLAAHARRTRGRIPVPLLQVPLAEGVSFGDFSEVPIPDVGDIVKMPSGFPGELKVGQVDGVEFISSEKAYRAIVAEMEPIEGGRDLYQRQKKAITTDAIKLWSIPSAEYVSDRDAYRVDASELQPIQAVYNPKLEGFKATAKREQFLYEQVSETVQVGAAAAAIVTLISGLEGGIATVLGSLASAGYLFALQRKVATMAEEVVSTFDKVLIKTRFIWPVLVCIVLALANYAQGKFDEPSLQMLSKGQIIGTGVGFLGYKVPIYFKQAKRVTTAIVSKEFDAKEGEALTAIQTALQQVRGVLKDNKKRELSAKIREVELKDSPDCVVVAGPSGVGRKSMIAKLIKDYPQQVGFTVSTTTRKPREGEVEGEDYFFVSNDEFDTMIANNQFVEWATAGDAKYGTSVASVKEVRDRGKICILDSDLEGVQDMVRRDDLEPYYIWLSPPTVLTLKSRLRKRGLESDVEIEKILGRGQIDMQYAASFFVFDKWLLNNEWEESYKEFREAISEQFDKLKQIDKLKLIN